MIKLGCGLSRFWWPKFVLPSPGAGMKCPPVHGKGIAAPAVWCAVQGTTAFVLLLVLLGPVSNGQRAEPHGVGHKDPKNRVSVY